MSSGGGGFFNRVIPWGGGGGATGGHQGGGPGRGVNRPRPQGPGGGRRGISCEDATEDDFTNDVRHLYGGINTPYVMLSAMLNTKPGGTLFSIQMAPLP